MKKELLRLETNIIGIITNGLVHRTPKRLILISIKKEIVNAVHKIGLDRAEAHSIWLDAVARYDEISKKTFVDLRKADKKFGKLENYEENLARRTSTVYNYVRKNAIMNDSLIKKANEIKKSIESREKHDKIFGINGIIKENREDLDNYSPFFLCSSHIDPAEDHKDWEGKMYFDEDWRKFVSDKDTKKNIGTYIRYRRLRSVQWVCGAPVYMVVRPNCKHYFTNLPIEEVLHDSPRNLVKKHKLYNPNENPIPQEEIVLNRYSERLAIEKHLNTLIKDDRLKKDIKDFTNLVRKCARICDRARKNTIK